MLATALPYVAAVLAGYVASWVIVLIAGVVGIALFAVAAGVGLPPAPRLFMFIMGVIEGAVKIGVGLLVFHWFGRAMGWPMVLVFAAFQLIPVPAALGSYRQSNMRTGNAGTLAGLVGTWLLISEPQLRALTPTSADLLLAGGIGCAVIAVVAVQYARKTRRPKRTYWDEFQEHGTKALAGGYRAIAAKHGCAPTAKTTDEKIVEIYSRVGRAFQEAAKRRGEHIPALFLNCIVLHFLQAYEMMGEQMVEEHLQYEVAKYLESGLRADYQHELPLF